MKVTICENRSWMYNCPVPWYTVVDDMSVDKMSVDADEMSVDELSWSRLRHLVALFGVSPSTGTKQTTRLLLICYARQQKLRRFLDIEHSECPSRRGLFRSLLI